MRPSADRITIGSIANSIGVAVGRGAVSIVNIVLRPDQTRDQRDKRVVLERVKYRIEGFLDRPSHPAIDLRKAEVPTAVGHVGDWFPPPSQLSSHLEPNSAPILDFFDKLGRSMLILGGSGSGKTTTLVELASDAIVSAEQDLGQPLPVILSLSTWRDSGASIADWLLAELNEIYGIPKLTGERWLRANDLLLLLDDLDRVGLKRIAACIKAINRFRLDHGLVGMVVCSRVDDYSATDIRLKLGGTITLQPLSPEQIDNYLVTAGSDQRPLRLALQKDQALQEIVVSPLMLHIASQVYHDLRPEVTASEREASVDILRRDFFDAYVSAMLRRGGPKQPYSPEETVSRLSWLARRMFWHSLSEFLIERLQPSWLRSSAALAAYVYASRMLISTIVSLSLAVLFVQLFLGYTSLPSYDLFRACTVAGLLGGAVAGTMDYAGFALQRGRQFPRGHRMLDLASSGAYIIVVFLTVAFAPRYFEFLGKGLTVFRQLEGFTTLEGLVLACFLGWFGGRASLRRDIQVSRATLVWSWEQWKAGTLLVGLLLAVVCCVLLGSLTYLSKFTVSRDSRLRIITNVGNTTTSADYYERFVAENYDGAFRLRDTADRVGMPVREYWSEQARRMSPPAFTSGMFDSKRASSPSRWPLVALSFGVVMGFSLLMGLSVRPVQMRVRPNQGTYLSLHNAVLIGLVIGMCVTVIASVNNMVSAILSFWL